MAVTERMTAIGNGQMCIVTTHEDGTQVFRTDAADVVTHEVAVLDNLGRAKYYTVHMSTALVMVPVGELGCVVFDPMPGMRDEKGRACYVQRVTLSRPEVADMTEKFQSKSRIIT